MIKGADWASYQGTKPRATGLDFVWIKATQGTTYVNPDLKQQTAVADAGNCVTGFYHFLEHGNIAAQVDHFLKTVVVNAYDMLAVDWETEKGKPTPTAAEKKLFIETLKQRVKNPVLLYCNKNFWLNVDKDSYCGDGLWIAAPDDPDGVPKITHAWKFQQTAIVDGVDRNVGNFATKRDLQMWIASFTGSGKVPTDVAAAGAVTTVDIVPAGVIGTEDKSTASGRVEHKLGYFLANLLYVNQQILAELQKQNEGK